MEMDIIARSYNGIFQSWKRRKDSMSASNSTSQQAEASVSTDASSLVNPSLQQICNDKEFVERFSVLFNNEVFSDIILRVGNERFFAHKFMLITSSEVFEAMLNEERWRESTQPEISLTEEIECEPVFSHFLRYIYTGSVGLTTDNVLPILLLADKYSIPDLRQSCVDYMLRHIVQSPDTNRTLSWYQYAKMTGNNLLMKNCLQFILSNFDIVLKTSDWLELTRQEIIEFLSSSDVLVSNEYELWLQLKEWLTQESHRESLEENLSAIIPLLRFTMISPKNLLDIEQSELCVNHPIIFRDKISAAYRYHSLLTDCVELTDIEEFRNYTADVYAIFNDMSLLNYSSVGKIDSKVAKRFTVPLEFISHIKLHKQTNTVDFDVHFWPKGHYTTFTLYGNHMGRQTDNTTLTIRRVTKSSTKPLSPMEATFTFIIYGVKNGVRYVAFTYSGTHVFTQLKNAFTKENIIPLQTLNAQDSPYLVNGNLDAKIFIKAKIVEEENAESRPSTK